MTEKTLDWLNLNRHRAYPLVNDERLVVDGKRIPDCVLLDCTVMDTRHGIGTPDLIFRRIDVAQERTHVDFTYAGLDFGMDITGGEDGISVFDGSSTGQGDGIGGEFVHARFVFSSHDRILDEAGEGTWEFSGQVLPTKIATVEASGVMGISTSGSAFVDGRELPGVATGDVHLVDGYRTQPVVHNGKVVVKVGNSYGFDPCHYYSGPLETPSCDDIMLFFCGQNAVNSGNVILKGGTGVTVTQGRKYVAKEDIIDTFGNVGIKKGEGVPCIEVVASSELMRIYRPKADAAQVDD